MRLDCPLLMRTMKELKKTFPYADELEFDVERAAESLVFGGGEVTDV